MKFKVIKIFIGLYITIFALPNSPALAALNGTSCNKLGKVQTSSGLQFICSKNGKKLIWKQIANSKKTQINQPNKETGSTDTVKPPTTLENSTKLPTSSTIPGVIINTSSLSDYRPIGECKLQNNTQSQDVNLSHSPRNWRLINIDQTIRILIFPVDFPDLISPTSNSPDFSNLITKFEEFYKSQSGNKLKFNWTISPNYSRMLKTIESYGVGARASGSVWQLNYDIQDLAFQKYNINDFDFVIGSAPTTTTRGQIASSPAFGASDSRYRGATYLGGDYWSNGTPWTIPAHEFGHFALGIADLYNFEASMLGQAGFEKQFQHLGVYDIMNYAGGAGLEFTSWNRWIGNLISDSQMLCQPDSSTITRLKPIEEVNQNVKGLVIPISNSVRLVIENRSAKGFDSNLPSKAQGLIVYTVNNAIESGYGPMQMVRKEGSTDIWYRDNALQVGDKLSYLGYTIKALNKSGDDFFVEVSKE